MRGRTGAVVQGPEHGLWGFSYRLFIANCVMETFLSFSFLICDTGLVTPAPEAA